MELLTERNCRICLSQCEMRDLDFAQFQEKYLKCTGFNINETDIPKKICSTCTSELISTSNFLVKCEETETLLRQMSRKEEHPPDIDMDVNEVLVETSEIDFENYAMVKEEPEDEIVDILKESIEQICELDTEIYEQPLNFKCDYCMFQVKLPKHIMMLNKHIDKIHGDILKPEIRCQKCPNATFKSKSVFDFHKKEFHSENKYKDHFTCTFCYVHSIRPESIYKHIITLHKNAEQFTCIVCQKIFRSKDHLRWHIKHSFCGTNIIQDCDEIEHQLKCDYCKFTCALEANMMCHVKKMHPNVTLAECLCKTTKIYCKALVEQYQKYRCTTESLCSKADNFVQQRAKQADGLTAVQRKALRQRSTVECEYCHKQIKQASLRRHIVTIHERVRYKCDLCDKSFSLKQSLQAHVEKVHQNKKEEFPCQHCDRKFNTWASRHYHTIRIHTKNFRFKCEICNHQFLHKADLDDHTTIHTGAKIRECPICHEMFSTRDSLRTHQETIHRTEPLMNCHICGKQFERRKQLKKHIKTIHEQMSLSFRKIIAQLDDVETDLEGYEEAEKIFEEYIENPLSYS